jgi:hypothetical protein
MVLRVGKGRGHGHSLRKNTVADSHTYTNAEAATYVARMSSQPNDTRKGVIDALVTALKVDPATTGTTVYARLDLVTLFAAHDSQAASLNLIEGTFTAVPSGTTPPTFSADHGYTGDGSTGYLDHGAAASTLTRSSLNDMSDLVWSLTDLQSDGRDAGATGSAGSYMVGRSTGGTLAVRANAGAGFNSTQANSLGLYGWTRTTSTASGAVKNGAIPTTSATASSALATGNLCTCRGATLYSARQIAARVIGKGFVVSEHLAIYNALHTYMQAVAGVA